MADLIAIINAQEAFINLYQETKRLAEELGPLERLSATHIQRLFRGTRVRIDIKYKSDAATEIKRVVRGHTGRRRARSKVQERKDFMQSSLFQYFTLQIQRCFRGYYSRKYRTDHSARRAYFRGIAEKNQEVLDMMAEYALVQISRDEQTNQDEKEGQFNGYAANLHHLLSTQNTRGVFKPLEKHLEGPTMNNIPVEDHIRGVVRDLLRSRGITKTGLIRNIQGTKKVPYLGMKDRLSVQASAPYDICKEDKVKETMLHKILIAGKEDFLAGGQTSKLLANFKPLSATGEPYMNPGSNPYLMRGVPASQQELSESKYMQKALFIRPTKVPYFTRTGGNMSAVHPNDLFEVIGEAEETGGAVHRNLGVSTRFGVSDRSDNRVPGGNIPTVQPRLSAVQHSKRVTMKRRTHVIKARLTQSENDNGGDSGSSSDGGGGA